MKATLLIVSFVACLSLLVFLVVNAKRQAAEGEISSIDLHDAFRDETAGRMKYGMHPITVIGIVQAIDHTGTPIEITLDGPIFIHISSELLDGSNLSIGQTIRIRAYLDSENTYKDRIVFLASEVLH
jgi:hypothetical protein